MVLKYVKMTECGSGLIRMILIRIILIFKWQYYVSTISYDSMILLVFLSHYSYVILLSVLSQGNANKKEKKKKTKTKSYTFLCLFCSNSANIIRMCVFFLFFVFVFQSQRELRSSYATKLGRGML